MEKLLAVICNQFQLPLESIHGLPHWQRVEALGMHLSAFTRADITVVKCFAYLHDSQRTSDDVDIEHGIRARDFVVVLINQGILSLTDTQARLLKTACEVHNTAYKLPMDPTISVCLDADRLDLWRLGVQPSEKLLFTEMGKKISKDKTLYYQICG